jgi:hypothetical protein
MHAYLKVGMVEIKPRHIAGWEGEIKPRLIAGWDGESSLAYLQLGRWVSGSATPAPAQRDLHRRLFKFRQQVEPSIRAALERGWRCRLPTFPTCK